MNTVPQDDNSTPRDPDISWVRANGPMRDAWDTIEWHKRESANPDGYGPQRDAMRELAEAQDRFIEAARTELRGDMRGDMFAIPDDARIEADKWDGRATTPAETRRIYMVLMIGIALGALIVAAIVAILGAIS